jgi:hypothetical protein
MSFRATTKESVAKFVANQAFDLKDRVKEKVMAKTGSKDLSFSITQTDFYSA